MGHVMFILEEIGEMLIGKTYVNEKSTITFNILNRWLSVVAYNPEPLVKTNGYEEELACVRV